MQRVIELFVMQGCQVCPQMEKTFFELQKKGEISELKVVDVQQQPELAEKYKIRSVPYYLINGIAFTGLKSQTEILSLLNAETDQKLGIWIIDQLAQGELSEVETRIAHEPQLREAMMQLLEDVDTPLMARIGLTAVIESLAGRGFFSGLETRFIQLADHAEERIAIDAIYYLQLLSTPASLGKLADIARSERSELQQQAQELLLEVTDNAVKH